LSIASILEKILILSGDVTTNKQERWVRAVGNGDFTDGVCTRIFGSTQNITIEETEIRLQSLSIIFRVLCFNLIYPDGKEALLNIS
jgi:hypothetical protein